MGANKKLAVLASAFGILSATMLSAAADARAANGYRYYGERPVYRGGRYAGYYPYPAGYRFYVQPEWRPDGWRRRSNAKGWDNTCLNVPWLPSQFACDAR
jgi:hypothetical protein